MQSYNYLFRQVDFDFVIVIVILWNIKFGYLTIKRKKNLLKFETERREFAKYLRSIEHFIQAVNSKNNFWTGCFFNFLLEVSQI